MIMIIIMIIAIHCDENDEIDDDDDDDNEDDDESQDDDNEDDDNEDDDAFFKFLVILEIAMEFLRETRLTPISCVLYIDNLR